MHGPQAKTMDEMLSKLKERPDPGNAQAAVQLAPIALAVDIYANVHWEM
jgi:hypothetical protein